MTGEAWGDPIILDVDEPKAPKKKRDGRKKPDKDKKPVGIPTLPEPPKVVANNEVRGGLSNRDRAIVNMKLDGASYQEISEALEIHNVASVKKAFERALAMTHSSDDWETLRMTAAARAEKLFQRSMAMASADRLVLPDGTEVANAERLSWHRQAASDLMAHATITGAKAPTKVELTPGEEQMDKIVAELVARMGHEDIVDAEVLEFETLEIESLPEVDYDDD